MKPSVMIDGGHGGADPGAIGPGGLKEKAVALSVALMTGGLLLGAGVDVFFTRKDDTFLSLPERARLANAKGVDLFLSIHCNSATVPASGFEAYTTPGQTDSDAYATDLFLSFGAEFPEKTKRLDSKDGDPDKEANFAVLRLTRMAAVLFELEFIHTAAGEAFLGNPVMQGRCAKALANGTLKRLGILAPTMPVLPQPEDDFNAFARLLARQTALTGEMTSLIHKIEARA